MNIRTDSLGRFAVTWQVDAAPNAEGQARLAALTHAFIDEGLPDGLLPGARSDELVCVRRVQLPAHRMRWHSSDSELITDWGRAAGRAVSEVVAAGGPDVVRYRSVSHARRDLVAALLRGHRDRLWAWRAADVWPVTGPAAAADAPTVQVLRSVLTTAVREEPYAGIGLVVELAGAGLLPRLVAALPEPVLALLAREAWRCTTGTPWLPTWPPVEASTRPSTTRGPHGDDGSDAAPARLVASLVARSVVVRALRGLPVAGAERPDGAAVALAAMAVLEVDPAPAIGPDAGRLLAELAGLLSGGGLRSASHPDGATRRGYDGGDDRSSRVSPPVSGPVEDGAVSGEDSIGSLGPGAGEGNPETSGPSSGVLSTGPGNRDQVTADRAPAGVTEAGSTSASTTPLEGDHPSPGLPTPRGAQTCWGGLLFLLPLVAETGLPDAVGADPDRFGPELRPALHELGLRILRRVTSAANADEDPAEPTDPAVLAFSGLLPDAEPPASPPHSDALELVVDDVAALLRSRLARSPVIDPSQADAESALHEVPLYGDALLGEVCRRRAVIEADPGWIDIVLELDEVSVDVRRAGLDLDPGYLPWLGCVVRFRYG